MKRWLHDAETALQAIVSSSTSKITDGTAYPCLEHSEWENLRGEIIAYRAMITGYYLGDGQTTLALCKEALAHLAKENLLVRAEVAYAQALAYHSSGDILESLQCTQQATELAQEANNTSATIAYLCAC